MPSHQPEMDFKAPAEHQNYNISARVKHLKSVVLPCKRQVILCRACNQRFGTISMSRPLRLRDEMADWGVLVRQVCIGAIVSAWPWRGLLVGAGLVIPFGGSLLSQAGHSKF